MVVVATGWRWAGLDACSLMASESKVWKWLETMGGDGCDFNFNKR
jgi:hypothetical protein